MLANVWTANGHVQLIGEVDISNVGALTADLLSHADFETVLVVDCTRLTFIDAAGARALAEVAKLTAGVRLEKAQPMVRRLIQLLDLPRGTAGQLFFAPEGEAPERELSLG